MIIVVLVVLAADVLLTGWLAWERKRDLAPRLPLPAFTNKSRCVQCNGELDALALDSYAYIQVGKKKLPVTMSTCGACVAQA